MDYREYYIEDHDLTIEIGVLSEEEVDTLLAKYHIDQTPKKNEYEDFLLKHLIKKQRSFMKLFAELVENDFQEFQRLKIRLISYILEVNPRLQPSELVFVDNKLMYVSNAIRLGKPTKNRLPMVPGWAGSLAQSNSITPTPLLEILDLIWDGLKRYDPTHDYRKQKVDILNVEVPILKLESNNTAGMILQDFIDSLCNGDVYKAATSQPLWIAHILAYTVPRIEEIKEALIEGGYLEVYGQSVVLLQLYIAVLQVNPELNWEVLDWSPYTEKAPPAPNNKRPPVRHRTGKVIDKKIIKDPKQKAQPSSREEVAAEQLHFKDVSTEEILSLKDRLKKYIVGQDEAIESLTDAIAVARVGLRKEGKPIGSFLFAGPTGVGKTELCKILAKELTADSLLRQDCSEYKSPHEVAKLFGSPPGYVGFEDNDPRLGQHTPPSTLATKIKKTPFSVVLFDEIEKADPAIYDVLLQMMDDGIITSGRGEQCTFSESLIILTSNIGTKAAETARSKGKLGFDTSASTSETVAEMSREIMEKEIKDHFKPEFLNRLTQTIYFDYLSEEACKEITEVLLEQVRVNLEKAQHSTLSWDDTVKQLIVDKGFKPEFGARNLERTIDQVVTKPLAYRILKEPIPEKSTVKLKVDGDNICFEINTDKVICEPIEEEDAKKTDSTE